MSYTTSSSSLCLTAMLMATGAESVLVSMSKENYKLLSDKRGGYIGIMGDLQEFAEASEKRLVELEVEDFPGVYDYDVSIKFGKWWAENDPTAEAGIAKLHEMIVDFFARGEETSEVQA